MAKKTKVPFRREVDDLTTIDDELDGAIAQLDQTNTRIGELLQSIEPPKQSATTDVSSEQSNENREAETESESYTSVSEQ